MYVADRGFSAVTAVGRKRRRAGIGQAAVSLGEGSVGSGRCVQNVGVTGLSDP